MIHNFFKHVRGKIENKTIKLLSRVIRTGFSGKELLSKYLDEIRKQVIVMQAMLIIGNVS